MTPVLLGLGFWRVLQDCCSVACEASLTRANHHKQVHNIFIQDTEHTSHSSGLSWGSCAVAFIHSGWNGAAWIHFVAVHLLPLSTGQPAGSWSLTQATQTVSAGRAEKFGGSRPKQLHQFPILPVFYKQSEVWHTMSTKDIKEIITAIAWSFGRSHFPLKQTVYMILAQSPWDPKKPIFWVCVMGIQLSPVCMLAGSWVPSGFKV